MNEDKKITGFSKLSKTEKIHWLAQNFLYNNPIAVAKDFASFWHDNIEEQKLFDGFSENTITNFYLPFGIAPNFSINGKMYAVPMVTEESSVVAAAANAAKFWLDRGGFKAKVLNTVKIGQVHFNYFGDSKKLKSAFPIIKNDLINGCKDLTANMEKRGGGILEIELLDMTDKLENYFQLRCSFETCDSMGANFINSVLERFGQLLVELIASNDLFTYQEKDVKVIMCILSNFTPDCVVRASVECPVKDLGIIDGMPAQEFAEKFVQAVKIAVVDPYRATTHNKGIMNGIDSVVIATGNDFRAIESCAHTYASRNGSYSSLSDACIEDGIFKFWIEIPLALGTVGGLTALHPLAKKSMELLGMPSASELMMITATVGLAQNFGAVKALTTSGIQQGHMKMHLSNIMMSLQASEEELQKAKEFFKDKAISFNAAREFLTNLRNRTFSIS